jgi:hypothetical protein
MTLKCVSRKVFLEFWINVVTWYVWSTPLVERFGLMFSSHSVFLVVFLLNQCLFWKWHRSLHGVCLISATWVQNLYWWIWWPRNAFGTTRFFPHFETTPSYMCLRVPQQN